MLQHFTEKHREVSTRPREDPEDFVGPPTYILWGHQLIFCGAAK